MNKSIIISLFAFTATVYAGATGQVATVAANMNAGAQAAEAAILESALARTGDGKQAAKRVGYEQASGAERAWRREQFAQLAKVTDTEQRAALISAIDARWAARQAELERLKAVAEAEQTAPPVRSTR